MGDDRGGDDERPKSFLHFPKNAIITAAASTIYWVLTLCQVRF